MSFFGDIMGGRAAQAGANYNASLIERDAKIKEMQADQAYKVYTTYDLPNFNHQAEQLEGTMKTSYAVSINSRATTFKARTSSAPSKIESTRASTKYLDTALSSA